jgi:GrpB-like predicted nucleotidyltransferase (UPF0157 family)/ribosomal protein S18 acetylase RimI-like enzyme
MDGRTADSKQVGARLDAKRVTLSPARFEDLEALVAIRIAAMRESLERMGRFDPQRARARLADGFAPDCTRHIQFDGARVGFVTVELRAGELCLDHLYIRPEYQGLGIGAEILAIVFAEADQRALPVRVGALRGSGSNRFYARHGFTLVAETEWDVSYVRAPKIDEAVEIVDYDSRWPSWFAADAAEIVQALGSRLRGLSHFGSTAVPGLAAKAIIDVLVAPTSWPLDAQDRAALLDLGYEHLGEAGVHGREYFRRRAEHDTNLAVVELDGSVWSDNLRLRDFLRAHPDAARAYADAKKNAWASGARRLLHYSREKAAQMRALLEAARSWRPAQNSANKPIDIP